jgi:hypothetical protein
MDRCASHEVDGRRDHAGETPHGGACRYGCLPYLNAFGSAVPRRTPGPSLGHPHRPGRLAGWLAPEAGLAELGEWGAFIALVDDEFDQGGATPEQARALLDQPHARRTTPGPGPA